MHYILSFIFLTFQAAGIWGGNQPDFDGFTIDNEITPVSIWSLGNYYYSSGEENRQEILHEIEQPYLSDFLKDNSSLSHFICEINQHLGDESLLLLSLLLDDDPQSRNSQFEQFYNNTDQTNLKALTSRAAQGEPLQSGDYEINDFSFAYFLIASYTNTNNIATEEYFHALADYLTRRVPDILTNYSEAEQDLIYATIFASLYETNQLHKIPEFADNLMEVSFIPPSRLKRDFYWGLDFAMSQAGRYDKSLRILREFTIPLSEFLGDESSLNMLKITQGTYLYHIGSYQAARETFMGLMENADDLPLNFQASLYNNLSLIFYKTGESSNYIDAQMNALEIARETENYDYQLRIYRNLHIFYRKNRNWNLAEHYINEAANLAQQINNTDELISIYVSKAVFENQFLGNRKAAYNLLDKAETYLTEQSNIHQHNRILAERSRLLNQDHQWKESKQIQKEIIQTSSSESDTRRYLGAMIELINIHINLANFDKARQLMREYRTHDISVLSFSSLVMAQTLEANLKQQSDDTNQALRLYEETTEMVLDRTQNTSELETGYWTVEPEYIRHFQDHTDFLIEQNRPEDALRLLDRVKTINDAALTDNPLVQAATLNEQELTEKRNLSEQMDRLRNQIFNASGREQIELRNRLERLSAQRANLLDRTTTHQFNDVNIRSVQRSLQSGQIVIHLTELDSTYYIARIDRNSVEIETLSLDAGVSELFEEAVHSLITGNTDLEKLYQSGREIQIDRLIESASSVIFIPDGFFHQLPLPVLPLTRPDSPHSYGSTTYIAERLDVRNANSLRDLTQRTSHRRFQTDFIGFGVSDFKNEQTNRTLISLPQAPSEITQIHNGLNRIQRKQSFINESATPSTFRDVAGSSRIVHLATHSEISDSDPLFSRLHFYADQDSDTDREVRGQLFAYELFDLNLQNDLIMLNSCESGGGRYLQGSGIMGISRALRYAGAQSLILNAWSVNDQFAADFATYFYEGLNQGESKSKALQRAKIEFIQGRNANPHYWGPYILNGDNRPMVSRREHQSGGMTLALLLIAGIVLARRSSSAANHRAA